jgi:hypothetical protein
MSTPAPPIPECPEIDAVVTTEIAVHLILRLHRDWEHDREATSAELERRTQAATRFAASPQFKARYGDRVGVLRVQTTSPAPSIVAHLLGEQGIELEQPEPSPATDAADAAAEPGSACSFCDRRQLRSDQVTMTDRGWACAACHRAWSLKSQLAVLDKPRRLRIPPRLIVPLLVCFGVLFALGCFYELRRLNSMNRMIRQHIPRE